jgi:hypothetical protein
MRSLGGARLEGLILKELGTHLILRRSRRVWARASKDARRASRRMAAGTVSLVAVLQAASICNSSRDMVRP